MHIVHNPDLDLDTRTSISVNIFIVVFFLLSLDIQISMRSLLLLLIFPAFNISASLFSQVGRIWTPSAAEADRFCVHTTGIPSSRCNSGYCVSEPGEPLNSRCDSALINDFAARYDRLVTIVRSYGPLLMRPGNSDFSRQLQASNYGEFLMYENRVRLIRTDGPNAVFSGFQGSSEPYIALLELFRSIPGSNWVLNVEYTEELAENRVSDLIGLVMKPGDTTERHYIATALVPGLSIQDPRTLVSEFLFSQLEESLLRLWALSVARQYVRFIDIEEVSYARLVSRCVDDVVSAVNKDVDAVPSTILDWLFYIVTRSSILLQPPLRRGALVRSVERINSGRMDLRHLFSEDLKWLTSELVVAFPDVQWDVAVAEDELVEFSRLFIQIERQVEKVPAAVIKMRIMHRIAGSLRINPTRIFELIPPVWIDFAIVFDPRPHHFLDGIVSIMSEMSVHYHIPLNVLMIGARAMRQLNLESIEIQGTDEMLSFMTSEPKLPRWLEFGSTRVEDERKRRLLTVLAGRIDFLRSWLTDMMPPQQDV